MTHRAPSVAWMFLCLLVPSAFADLLAKGAVYFDSLPSLEETQKLSEAKDNARILELVQLHHVSEPTLVDLEIDVISRGIGNDSASEFRFGHAPTTYWTLTKFILPGLEPVVRATPTPAPTPKPTPKPTPRPALSEEEPEPKVQKHVAKKRPPLEEDDDDDDGQRIWHQVNGEWKYYYRKGKPPEHEHHRIPVRKAIPLEVPVLRAIPLQP